MSPLDARGRVRSRCQWNNWQPRWLALTTVVPIVGAMIFSSTVKSDPDAHWSDLFGGPGVSGDVQAAVTWNGDLVVGGWITSVGGASAGNLARWDGATWRALGSGLNGNVTCLAVFDGDLYVGGRFTQAGQVRADGIARWDGSGWHSLGSWLHPAPNHDQVIVNAMLVTGGRLAVGGKFLCGGGNQTENIAIWDGTGWSALAEGLRGTQYAVVYSLATLGGDLVAGGEFSTAGQVPARNIALWDGAQWLPFGLGLESNVLSIVEFDGNLYAGGQFSDDAGVEYIARWDGEAWVGVGDGLGHFVEALGVWNGRLYAGGSFRPHGPDSGSGIAVLDGPTWRAVDRGTNGWVRCLAAYDDALVVGGWFSEAGKHAAHGVALWRDETWSALGSPGAGLSGLVSVIASYNDGIVAGGDFREAGVTPTNNVALLQNGSWIPLGEGFNGSVYALQQFDGDLIAGGLFSIAGGDSANSVARWNGSIWSPMGSRNVFEVSQFLNDAGTLLAAGTFRRPEGGFFSLGKWDGRAWTEFELPEGVNVSALALYEGDLIVSGLNPRPGYPHGGYVARWNGERWNQLGKLDDQVRALQVYQGKLVAGGDFAYNEDTSTRLPPVAVWDDSTWTALGAPPLGAGSYSSVYSLAVLGADLVAGGEFTQLGGTAGNAIARWSGSGWEPFGSGVRGSAFPGRVLTLLVHDGALYAGGDFTSAGGKASFFMARWDEFLPGEPVSEASFALAPPYPNPLHGAALLPFVLSTEGHATLTVHDVRGRLIATILDDNFGVGRHVGDWSGRTSDGDPVAAGVYYLRLSVAGHNRSRRLVVVH